MAFQKFILSLFLVVPQCNDEDYTVVQSGEGDIEINVEDYLRATRGLTQVTRKNKIVCTAAFAVLIITICGYVAGLAFFHNKHANDVLSDLHFKSPAEVIYFLMLSDVVASIVGIWTCITKTGPQPMIYACIWLLLSSLVNLCVVISLTFETKGFRERKEEICHLGNPNTDECMKLNIILWCSLLSFLPKLIAVFLCRINYPQVFNWMMGKDVYVEENVLPEANNKFISNAESLGGAYFDAPNLARIAARGSLGGTAVIGRSNSNSQAIFVTKEDEENKVPSFTETVADDVKRSNKRRSTFFTV